MQVLSPTLPTGRLSAKTLNWDGRRPFLCTQHLTGGGQTFGGNRCIVLTCPAPDTLLLFANHENRIK